MDAWVPCTLHTSTQQCWFYRTETEILNAFLRKIKNIASWCIHSTWGCSAELHRISDWVPCCVPLPPLLLTSWAYLTYCTHVTKLLTCGFRMHGGRDIYLKLLISFYFLHKYSHSPRIRVDVCFLSFVRLIAGCAAVVLIYRLTALCRVMKSVFGATHFYHKSLFWVKMDWNSIYSQ